MQLSYLSMITTARQNPLFRAPGLYQLQLSLQLQQSRDLGLVLGLVR